MSRYPDEEAGQVPMAFVVRNPQSSLSGSDIIDFVAKQVGTHFSFISTLIIKLLDSLIKNNN